jgi:hypothetical protein
MSPRSVRSASRAPARVDVPRLALTAMEAPAAIGVSHHFFKEHVAGELRWVRRGSKKLVAVSELQSWLERNAARVFEEAS